MADKRPFEPKDEATRPCAICGKPMVETYAPFCSKRCADVDLHKWLGGVYAVPDEEIGTTEDEGE